ncbi:MAG: hypothetical protein QMC70_09790, partial [Bacteroidia bacterium]
MKNCLTISILLFLISCSEYQNTNNNKYPNYKPEEWDKLIKDRLPSLKNDGIHFSYDLYNSDNIDTSKIFDFVEGLHIMKTHLDSIPKDILVFRNLKELSILHSQIDTLYNWIGEFNNLQKFSIYDSKVKHIPKGIGNLSN